MCVSHDPQATQLNQSILTLAQNPVLVKQTHLSHINDREHFPIQLVITNLPLKTECAFAVGILQILQMISF